MAVWIIFIISEIGMEKTLFLAGIEEDFSSQVEK